MNVFTASVAERKENKLPVNMIMYSCPEKFSPDFSKSYPVAANMVGMARKKENSTAWDRERPETRPPIIEAAERETPGITEID